MSLGKLATHLLDDRRVMVRMSNHVTNELFRAVFRQSQGARPTPISFFHKLRIQPEHRNSVCRGRPAGATRDEPERLAQRTVQHRGENAPAHARNDLIETYAAGHVAAESVARAGV